MDVADKCSLSLSAPILLDKYPEMELLGHEAGVFFVSFNDDHREKQVQCEQSLLVLTHLQPKGPVAISLGTPPCCLVLPTEAHLRWWLGCRRLFGL